MSFKCKACGKEWSTEDEECPTCGSNKKVEISKPEPAPTLTPARRRPR